MHGWRSQARLTGAIKNGALRVLQKSLLLGEGHAKLSLEISPEQAGSV